MEYPLQKTVSQIKKHISDNLLSKTAAGDTFSFADIVLLVGQGGTSLVDGDTLAKAGVKNGETLAVMVIPRFEWDDERTADTCRQQTFEETKEGHKFHLNSSSNNYKPVFAKVGYTSGIHRWRVKGTNWEFAQAGIARPDSNMNEWIGREKTSRVFSNGSISDQSEFTHRITKLTEKSVLTLELDMEAGTFSAFVDNDTKPRCVEA